MTDDGLNDLVSSFSGVPIVRKGDYDYFVHPLSDGIPLIDPELLDITARLMSRLIPSGCDYEVLVTAEAMGIPLTTAISMMTKKPYSIVRKRSYGTDGEIEIRQRTGYSEGVLYVNLPPSTNRCIIIDDVLSTGGTLRSLIEGIRVSGSEPLGAVFLVDKMGEEGRKAMEENLGVWIRPLLYVDIYDGICEARPTEYHEMI
jgi:adenine phosphoribosyltransferase